MIVRATALLLPLLAATPALAHGGHSEGFGAGFAHPLLGLDHLVAMLAIGLWAAQRQMLALPVGFLAGMAGGIALGIGFELPGVVEHAVAGTLVLIGLAIALAVRLPAPAAVAAATVFGLLHGAAHGGEVAGPAAMTAAGMLLGSALLHAVGYAAGTAAAQRVARAGGAAVAALGLLLLLA